MAKMKRDTGVFKRKASGVWYHRVHIPVDVRPYYSGKVEFPAKSLGTTDLREANRLARQRLAEIEAEFEGKRNPPKVPSVAARPIQKKPLTEPVLVGIEKAFLAQLKRAVNEASADLFERAEADPTAFWTGQIVPPPQDEHVFKGQRYSYWNDVLCGDGETPIVEAIAYTSHMQHKARLSEAEYDLSIGRLARVELTARNLLAPYSIDDRNRLDVLGRLLTAEISFLTALVAGEAVKFEKLPLTVPDTIEPNDDPLLSVVVEAWIADKTRQKLTQRRIEDCKSAADLFIETAGDKSMSAYSKSDALSFKKLIEKLPANRSKLKHTRGLTTEQMAQLGQQPMAPKTANDKYLATVRNLFEYAIKNYSARETNPFSHAKIASPKSSARDEWDPFSENELTTFFNGPLYGGCKSKKHWTKLGEVIPRDSAYFWVPLILLFTGARVNEICKLRTADVCELHQTHCFRITSKGPETSGIDDQLKNRSSERIIPVHPILIRIGLLDFVGQVRATRSERLFSELKPNRYGKMSDGLSKKFNRTYLPGLGIKRPKLSLRSFRHNFTDAAVNSGTSHEIVQHLRGDTLPGMLARYGKGQRDVDTLAQVIAILNYKKLDLSHLLTDVSTETASDNIVALTGQ